MKGIPNKTNLREFTAPNNRGTVCAHILFILLVFCSHPCPLSLSPSLPPYTLVSSKRLFFLRKSARLGCSHSRRRGRTQAEQIQEHAARRGQLGPVQGSSQKGGGASGTVSGGGGEHAREEPAGDLSICRRLESRRSIAALSSFPRPLARAKSRSAPRCYTHRFRRRVELLLYS